MKCGARVALGVAGGYFLGRTKKMKLALMLAGMAAGQRAGGPTGLLSQGAKLLGSSPEVSRLTGELRGRLMDAGKGAAIAVAARQVESLTDRLGTRVESIAGGVSTPKRRKAEPEDDYEEPAGADDELDEDVGEEADEADDDVDETDDVDGPEAQDDVDETEAQEEEPAPRRPSRGSAHKTDGAGGAATRTVSRPASGAGRAGNRATSTGRRTARTTKNQRGDA